MHYKMNQRETIRRVHRILSLSGCMACRMEACQAIVDGTVQPHQRDTVRRAEATLQKFSGQTFQHQDFLCARNGYFYSEWLNSCKPPKDCEVVE